MTVLHFLHTFQIFEILRCIIYIPSAVDLLCDIIEIKQFIILIFLTQNLHTPLYLILSSVYPPVIYCNRGCVCFLLKTNTVTCVLDFTSLFPSQGLLIISIVLYWIFNSSIPYHLNMIDHPQSICPCASAYSHHSVSTVSCSCPYLSANFFRRLQPLSHIANI